MRGTLALGALLALALAACGPRQKTDSAERDQEATTAILWAYRQDPANRFRDVRVKGYQGVIELEGRVDDARSAEEAVAIARARARGCEVVSKLDARPR